MGPNRPSIEVDRLRSRQRELIEDMEEAPDSVSLALHIKAFIAVTCMLDCVDQEYEREWLAQVDLGMAWAELMSFIVPDIERARHALEALGEQRAEDTEPADERRVAVQTEPDSDTEPIFRFWMSDDGKRLHMVLATPGGQVEVTLKGEAQVTLARAVLEQPDQTHSWRDLLESDLKAGNARRTAEVSVERTGRRVREKLPPALKGYWEQTGTGVRWASPSRC